MQDLLESSDMGQKQRFKENSHKQKHNLLNSQVRSSVQNGHSKATCQFFPMFALFQLIVVQHPSWDPVFGLLQGATKSMFL